MTSAVADPIMAVDGLRIGADQTPDSARRFSGLIDEVAIWNRVLDAGEISSLYNSGAGAAIAIPEPSALALAAMGLAGIVFRRRK